MELVGTLGIDWRLFALQAVNFAIVFFVLFRWAFGPILKALHDREQRLAAALTDAEASRRERAAAAGERTATLARAREEAGAILSAARADGEAIRTELSGKARVEAEALAARARAALAAERQDMLADAKTEVATLVAEATARVLPRTLTAEDHAALLREAAAEVRRMV